MSSWFSFLRSVATQETEEQNEDQQPSTSTAPETPERSTTSMLREFPEEQRRHIREVLKRAEQSKQQAKVVFDSDVLEQMRQRNEHKNSTSESFDGNMEGFGDEDDDLGDEEFLQMEALPDAMEVTLGPSRDQSRDQSPFPMSDISTIDFNADDRCYTPSISIDIPMDPTPEPNLVTRGMKMLSQKIIEWVRSLDEEDGYEGLPVKKPEINLEPTDELGELFFEGSPLDDYCSHLSRNLCILAIADYMTKMHIQSLQNYDVIVKYAQQLAERIILSALHEIMHQKEKRQHVRARFDEFVEQAVKWAVEEALTKVVHEQPLQIEIPFNPTIFVEKEQVIEEQKVEQEPLKQVDDAGRIIDSNEWAMEVSYKALHKILAEFQIDDDQQLSATTQNVYTILDDSASDEDKASSTKASDDTQPGSTISSTTPENYSDDESADSEEDQKYPPTSKLKTLAVSQIQQELPIVEIRVCPSSPGVFDSQVEFVEFQKAECVEKRKTYEEDFQTQPKRTLKIQYTSSSSSTESADSSPKEQLSPEEHGDYCLNDEIVESWPIELEDITKEKRALSPDLLISSTNEIIEEITNLPDDSIYTAPEKLHSNSSSETSSVDTVINKTSQELTETELEHIRLVEQRALEAEELKVDTDFKSTITDRPQIDSDTSSPTTSSADTVIEHEFEDDLNDELNDELPTNELVESWPIEADDYSHIPTSPDHYKFEVDFKKQLDEPVETTQNDFINEESPFVKSLETSDSCYEILKEVPDRPVIKSSSTSSADTLTDQEHEAIEEINNGNLVESWPIEEDEYSRIPTSPDHKLSHKFEDKDDEQVENSIETGQNIAQQIEVQQVNEKSVQSSPTSSADSSVDDEVEEIETLPKPESTLSQPEDLLSAEEIQQIERIQRLAETMGLVDSKYHGLIESTIDDYDTNVQPIQKEEKRVLPTRPPPPTKMESTEVKQEPLLTEDEIEHIRRIQEMADQAMMQQQPIQQISPQLSPQSSKTSSADSIDSTKEELPTLQSSITDFNNFDLTAEELAHIERIKQLAEEQQLDTVGHLIEPPVQMKQEDTTIEESIPTSHEVVSNNIKQQIIYEVTPIEVVEQNSPQSSRTSSADSSPDFDFESRLQIEQQDVVIEESLPAVHEVFANEVRQSMSHETKPIQFRQINIIAKERQPKTHEVVSDYVKYEEFYETTPLEVVEQISPQSSRTSSADSEVSPTSESPDIPIQMKQEDKIVEEIVSSIFEVLSAEIEQQNLYVTTPIETFNKSIEQVSPQSSRTSSADSIESPTSESPEIPIQLRQEDQVVEDIISSIFEVLSTEVKQSTIYETTPIQFKQQSSTVEESLPLSHEAYSMEVKQSTSHETTPIELPQQQFEEPAADYLSFVFESIDNAQIQKSAQNVQPMEAPEMMQSFQQTREEIPAIDHDHSKIHSTITLSTQKHQTDIKEVLTVATRSPEPPSQSKEQLSPLSDHMERVKKMSTELDLTLYGSPVDIDEWLKNIVQEEDKECLKQQIKVKWSESSESLKHEIIKEVLVEEKIEQLESPSSSVTSGADSIESIEQTDIEIPLPEDERVSQQQITQQTEDTSTPLNKFETVIPKRPAKPPRPPQPLLKRITEQQLIGDSTPTELHTFKLHLPIPTIEIQAASEGHRTENEEESESESCEELHEEMTPVSSSSSSTTSGADECLEGDGLIGVKDSDEDEALINVDSNGSEKEEQISNKLIEQQIIETPIGVFDVQQSTSSQIYIKRDVPSPIDVCEISAFDIQQVGSTPITPINSQQFETTPIQKKLPPPRPQLPPAIPTTSRQIPAIPPRTRHIPLNLSKQYELTKAEVEEIKVKHQSPSSSEATSGCDDQNLSIDYETEGKVEVVGKMHNNIERVRQMIEEMDAGRVPESPFIGSECDYIKSSDSSFEDVSKDDAFKFEEVKIPPPRPSLPTIALTNEEETKHAERIKFLTNQLEVERSSLSKDIEVQSPSEPTSEADQIKSSDSSFEDLEADVETTNQLNVIPPPSRQDFNTEKQVQSPLTESEPTSEADQIKSSDSSFEDLQKETETSQLSVVMPIPPPSRQDFNVESPLTESEPTSEADQIKSSDSSFEDLQKETETSQLSIVMPIPPPSRQDFNLPETSKDIEVQSPSEPTSEADQIKSSDSSFEDLEADVETSQLSIVMPIPPPSRQDFNLPETSKDIEVQSPSEPTSEADQIKSSDSSFEDLEADVETKPQQFVSKPPIPPLPRSSLPKIQQEPALSEEEIAHIRRIEELANQSSMQIEPTQFETQESLTEEELNHIRRIEQLANEAMQIQPQIVQEEIKQQAQSPLTESEPTSECDSVHSSRASLFEENLPKTEEIGDFKSPTIEQIVREESLPTESEQTSGCDQEEVESTKSDKSIEDLIKASEMKKLERPASITGDSKVKYKQAHPILDKILIQKRPFIVKAQIGRINIPEHVCCPLEIHQYHEHPTTSASQIEHVNMAHEVPSQHDVFRVVIQPPWMTSNIEDPLLPDTSSHIDQHDVIEHPPTIESQIEHLPSLDSHSISDQQTSEQVPIVFEVRNENVEWRQPEFAEELMIISRPQFPPPIQAEEPLLTNEEIMHIERIKMMAAQLEVEQTSKNDVASESEPTSSADDIRSDEELPINQPSFVPTEIPQQKSPASESEPTSSADEIRSEDEMEEIVQDIKTKPPIPRPPRQSLPTTQQSLTEEELAHIRRIEQLANQSAMQAEPIPLEISKHDVQQEPTEQSLTEDEIAHILRIEQLANEAMQIQPQVVQEEPKSPSTESEPTSEADQNRSDEEFSDQLEIETQIVQNSIIESQTVVEQPTIFMSNVESPISELKTEDLHVEPSTPLEVSQYEEEDFYNGEYARRLADEALKSAQFDRQFEQLLIQSDQVRNRYQAQQLFIEQMLNDEILLPTIEEERTPPPSAKPSTHEEPKNLGQLTEKEMQHIQEVKMMGEIQAAEIERSKEPSPLPPSFKLDSPTDSTPTKSVRFQTSTRSESFSSHTSGADSPDSEDRVQLVHIPTKSTSNEEFIKQIVERPAYKPSADFQLTAEEIEHIRRIQELADKEASSRIPLFDQNAIVHQRISSRRLISVDSICSPTLEDAEKFVEKRDVELSAEELSKIDQIRRMSAEIVSTFNPYSVKPPRPNLPVQEPIIQREQTLSSKTSEADEIRSDISEETTQIQQSVSTDFLNLNEADHDVLIRTPRQSLQKDVELTAEELEHIARIQRMAEEMSSFEPTIQQAIEEPIGEFTGFKLSNDNYGLELSSSTKTSEADEQRSGLSSQQAIEEKTPTLFESSVPTENVLTEDEIAHILRIEQLAKEAEVQSFAPIEMPVGSSQQKEIESPVTESEPTSKADSVNSFEDLINEEIKIAPPRPNLPESIKSTQSINMKSSESEATSGCDKTPSPVSSEQSIHGYETSVLQGMEKEASEMKKLERPDSIVSNKEMRPILDKILIQKQPFIVKAQIGRINIPEHVCCPLEIHQYHEHPTTSASQIEHNSAVCEVPSQHDVFRVVIQPPWMTSNIEDPLLPDTPSHIDQHDVVEHPPIIESQIEHLPSLDSHSIHETQDYIATIPIEETTSKQIEWKQPEFAEELMIITKPIQAEEPLLTSEEISHIERIKMMATQLEAQNKSLSESEPTSNADDIRSDEDELSEHLEVKIVPSRPPLPKTQQSLTEEELAHIRRIEELANESAMQAEPIQQSLTEEELAHIRRIEELANESAMQTEPTQQSLTEEELAHIRRIEELANESAMQAEPIQQSLTEEELAHIKRIEQLANESFVPIETTHQILNKSSASESEPTSEADSVRSFEDQSFEENLSKPLEIETKTNLSLTQEEPLLTNEEIMHIEKIKAMAAQLEVEQTSKNEIASPATESEPTSKADSFEDDLSEQFEVKIPPLRPSLPAIQQKSQTESESTSKADSVEDQFIGGDSFEETGLLDDRDFVKTPEPFSAKIEEPIKSSELFPEKIEEPVTPPIEEFTQEDLGHIVKLQRMFKKPIKFSPPKQKEPIQQEASSTPKIDEIKIEPPVNVESTRIILPPTQDDFLLNDSELEHIEKIKLMSQELSSIEPAIKEAASILHKSMSSRTSSADEVREQSFEVPETTTILPPTQDDFLLNNEELEHIEKIKKMAQNIEIVEPAIKEAASILHKSMSSRTSSADEVGSFEVPEVLPIELETTTILPPTQDDFLLNDEELEHIARIQRMANEMSAFEPTIQQKSLSSKTSEADDIRSEEQSFDVPETLPIEFEHESMAKTPRQSLQQDVELTAEELEHIARIKRMADEMNIITEPTIQEEIHQQKSVSSKTSEADSNRSENQSFDVSETLPTEIEHDFLAKTPEPPKFEEPLSAEELEHIARIQRMADEMNMTNESTIQEEIHQQKSLSSKTSEADSIQSEDQFIGGDSFEDTGLLDHPEFAKTPEPIQHEPMKIEEPLSAEELEHIARIQRMADEMNITSEPIIQHEPIQQEIQQESPPSSPTSNADSNRSEDQSLDVSETLPTEIEHDFLAKTPEPPKFELSQQELEHIARIQRMADEMNMTSEPIIEHEPIQQEIQQESPPSSPTSNADSNRSEDQSFDVSETLPIENESMTKTPEPPKFELSQQELDHIARIQRMADEMNTTTEPTIQQQTSISSKTSSADQSPSVESEQSILSTPQRTQLSKDEDTIAFADEINRLNAELAAQEALNDTSLPLADVPMRSHSTVVSYTDRLKKALPTTLVKSTQHSGSFSSDTLPDRRRLLKQTKSSSVHVLYTGDQTLEERKLSFVSEPEGRRRSTATMVISNQKQKEDRPRRGQNPYEWCEQKVTNGTELCDVDFMVRLNFMARRLTEQIAEAAAEDLVQFIQMKSNPRIRYFCPEYLLDFLDEEPDSSDEELETTQELEQVEKEAKKREHEEEPLAYSIEHIRDEPSANLGFDLFSYFRRKSTERPRSALSYLQAKRSSPLPSQTLPIESIDQSRKWSTSNPRDILQLVRKSSIESNASTTVARPATSVEFAQLPEEAMRDLSQEEREHIQRVMSSASRANTSTPAQDSRRSSSAMYSLPELEDLNTNEREHINQILQKLEQTEQPYIPSAIAKSKSAGDLERPVKIKQESRESSGDLLEENITPKPSDELSQAELEHIRRMEAMIAEQQMMDTSNLEPKVETRKEVIEEPKEKKSMFGGFKLGGGLKDALKKTSQRMNENVSAFVQTASTIEKPTALQDLKPSILGDSLKRFAKKDTECASALTNQPIVDRIDSIKSSNQFVAQVDDVHIAHIFSTKPIHANAPVPIEWIAGPENFTTPIVKVIEAGDRLVETFPPPISENLPPQSTKSSIDSGLAKTSSDEEDELDAVGRAVDQDESIAWLQERIEAMNQTLEAYEHDDFLNNPFGGPQTQPNKQPQQLQEDTHLADVDASKVELATASAKTNDGAVAAFTENTEIRSDFFGTGPTTEAEKHATGGAASKQHEDSIIFPYTAEAIPGPLAEPISDSFPLFSPSAQENLKEGGFIAVFGEGEEDFRRRPEAEEDFREAGQENFESDASFAPSQFAPESPPEFAETNVDNELNDRRKDDVQSLPAALIEQPPLPPQSSPKMFSQGKKSGGGFGGFGLGKFVQQAKQAGQQIQAKAQEAAQIAQQAASTGDLSQIGSQLTASVTPQQPARSQSALNIRQEPTTPLQSSVSPLPDLSSQEIPPGLEHLSEEERLKIMAVMACAEIDAAAPAPQAAMSRPVETSKPPVVELPKPTPVIEQLPQPTQPVKQVEPTTPSISGIDESILSGLSAEEREQILAVMRMAEADQGMPQMTSQPAQKLEESIMQKPIDERVIEERTEVHDSTTQRSDLSEPMIAQERPITQPPPPPKSQSTTSVTMESGYVSSAPSYTTDMSSTSMDFTMPPPPLFAETLTEEPLVDSAPYQQEQRYEPEMAEMEEIEDSIITTSFGAPPEKPVEQQKVIKEQITERPNRMEQKETDEAEVDEDVWMQPQQQYRLPESWEPKSPGRMWTTVFSDDGDMAASEYDESTSGPFSYNQPGQQSSAPPPYVDTQKTYSDDSTSQPYVEKRVKASSPSSFKAIADELPQAEEAFAKEYLIYADRDQQDFLEQYGRVESGVETTASRHFNDTTPDSKFYHDAFHSADGSFEVQMEDPFSPTSSGGIVEETIEQTTKSPQQQFVASSTLSKRSPIAPAETGTLQSKKKKTPEITITSHEEEKDDDSDAETSPSDEDDYPDQVIEAPTAPMTSTHLIEQEQQRRSQNEYAQEVLRQIQSFGEAADDEFDVQWAASMTAKKEQQKDQPNGQLPFVSDTEQPQVQPEIQQEKPPQQQLQQPSQRINPFLESPEPEDEDTVTVEQVSLDADDIDYHQAIQYYKNSHQELYHHRPGPVFTIPEGDEGVEAKGDRKLKPQLLERRALHTTKILPLVPEDAKKKQQDTYTTGYQLPKKPTESSDATTPTKPIRTAPPPPDSSNLPPGTEDPNQIGRVHKFTPETHQVDDLLPASAYTHHNHVARGTVASVGESDASFLAQTFGMQPKKPESSTLGSQLATADHSVIEVVDDSTMSKLKRSPAMSILSSNKPPQTEDVLPQITGSQKSLLSREEENALLGLHSAQQQIPTSQQQHDLLLLSSSDMGRRKLPTLPQGQTAPYHQIPSVSAATEKPAETSHRFDASTSTASRISQQPLPATLYKYGYSTVGYTHHPPSHHHPIDPAILPGAPFRTVQPASIATVPKRPGIIGTARSAPVSPKLSDTMSQLLFKQELRQALSRRRHEQETVEIEANHREFLIRRMMNSGLIPPDCRRDIDSVPSVTKCDLPYELVAGARVVPADFYIHQQKRQYGTRQAYSQQTSPRHVDWTQSVLAGTSWTPSGQMHQTAMSSGAYRQSPTRRSVACQYEHSTTPKQYEAYHGSPLKVHYTPHERKAPKIDSATQTMIASETQTDTAQVDLLGQESYRPTTYQSASTSYQPTSGYQREERTTSYVAPDLLDATRRYFETYDRRLKDTSDALLKHQRFQFSDATNPQEMEWKREQVRRELERRKQKVASMIDLRSLQQQQRTWENVPADYSSRLPASSQRYGSLPRRFNAAATDMYNIQDTPSRRTNLYGSLPRNFERGDLYDSTGFYSLPQQQLPSAYTRSAAQLDRQYYPSYFDTTPVRRRPASYDDLTGRLAADNLASRQFAADDYNPVRRVDEYGTNVADDMLLSQYANYVNTQINAAGFLDDPLLTETNRYAGQSYPSASQNYLPGTTYPTSYPTTAQSYVANYPGVATPDYTPPLSDYTYADRVFNAQSQPVAPYITDYAGELPRVNIPNQSIYNQRAATYDPRLQPTYDLSLPSGSATYDPRLSATTGDYVYSRRENNYGSRPAQPIGNYGNFGYQTMRAGNPNLNTYQQRSTWNTLPASYMTNPQWESTQPPPTSFYDRQQVVQPTDLYAQRSFDERWPAGYTQQQRIPYSCSTQPRAVPQPYSQTTSAFQAKARARANPLLLQGIPKRRGYLQPTVNVLDTASLGRNEKRKLLESKAHKANVRSGQSMMNINGTQQSHQPTHLYSRSRNGTKIKRILLTRRYRHANVYHDLGFRVTGGKKLSNGDLGAFVTAVNRNKAYDTLGELKEGDQVLEWNGILLRGKTFEEVERIINATSGEIEVVIKCADAKNHKHQRSENIYDLTSDEIKRSSHQKQDYAFSPRDAPPIPAHRKSLSHSYYDQEDISRKQRLHYKIHSDDETLGQLQICLGYDQLNSLLLVTIISAHGLRSREYNGNVVLPNPFVKIYMLPGRKVINKRRTKYVSNTQNPEWHQTVDYLIGYEQLPAHFLEFTVWDYDKYNDNICLGQLIISLSNIRLLDNAPRWFDLQPADKPVPTRTNGTLTGAPYSKPRTLNSNYFYNPAHLDLSGYPAI